MTEWTRIGPALRVNYQSSVKASLTKRKDGSSSLKLCLSKLLAESFADPPAQCEAFHGAGDDNSLMKLVFTADGDVRVSKMGKGAFVIWLDKPAGLETAEGPNEACEFVAKDAASLTFRLPRWSRGRAAAQPAAAPPAPALRPGSELTKLDAAAYLRKQGRACEKLADGTYRYEGEPAEPARVLSLVNHFRTKSGLKPLILLDLA